MATSTYGTPYVQGSDLVSAYPTVSSSLATRVDEVSYKGNGLNAQTGTTYTLVAGDAGKTITLSNASPVAVTLPQDSTADLPDGAVVTFYNLGAGAVTISQGTGATLNGGSITLVQYAVTTIIKLSSNTYGRYDNGGGGLSLITTQSFSAVSSVSVNNCFTGDYDNYRIVFQGAGSDATSRYVQWRQRVSGADNTTSNYQDMWEGVSNAAAGFTRANSGQTVGNLCWVNTGLQSSATVDVINPAKALPTAMIGGWQALDSTVHYAVAGGSVFSANTVCDGFSLITASGTMTGTFSVYGYKK